MEDDNSVNPEGIQVGDYITTKWGVATVSHLDEVRGVLSYKPITNEYEKEDISIRSVRLLGSPRPNTQLNFPFIDKIIEDAINARNAELVALRQGLSITKIPSKSRVIKKDTTVKENKELAALIKAMGGVENLLKELKGEDIEDTAEGDKE